MTETPDTQVDMHLFRETGKEVFRRLRSARHQEDIFAVLSWAAKEMNRTFGRTDRAITASVACRSGCDFCCRGPMGVQAHEVFFAASYVQKHFSSDEIAGVISRASTHRARIIGINSTEYLKLVQPCALLRDGKCTIYDARPEVCRAHHTSNAKVCEDALGDPLSASEAYVLPLRARMFGTMLGIDKAFAEAGYDGRAYDFGSALHEALTDSQCIIRWLRKEPAFSDSCREPPMQEGTSLELRSSRKEVPIGP